MFGRKRKRADGVGAVDGGEGRGIPLGGRDERPPTGYSAGNDDYADVEGEWSEERDPFDDRDFAVDDEGPDRRRDPLRR